MKVMRQGQCLRHDLFGIGIAKSSNEDRTTIDFYEHGTKTFVTGMLEGELLAEAPPRPQGSRSAAAKKPKAKAATE